MNIAVVAIPPKTPVIPNALPNLEVFWLARPTIPPKQQRLEASQPIR